MLMLMLGPFEHCLNNIERFKKKVKNSSRCHNAGGNMNITLALTVHTRAPLDLGLVSLVIINNFSIN